MEMEGVKLQEYARQMLESRGDKAVADAAQKALALEQQGKSEEAGARRSIEASLKEMLGPHQG